MTFSFSIDANGNQITRVIGADTFTLTYDAENRLVEVKKNNVSMATFVYDGDGRQVKATVNGITTTYVGAHYEVTGSSVTKYYFAGTQRIALRKDGVLSYLLSDHLGSSSVTTDANGNSIATMLYKAWGETRYASGSLNTDYEYTGQRNEGEIGLHFYNARWYDDYLNHFTQPDSIVPDPYNSQDWDRYAYARNNPLKYNDPTGHSTCSTVSNQYAQENCEDWSPENEDYDPCAFNTWDCSGPIDWSNGTRLISRPIIGIHLGLSGNLGIAVEDYGYIQGDILFDPSSGAFYGMTTAGNGGYIGTPNGLGFEVYGGTSSVHGVPGDLAPAEVEDLLAGPNADVAVELGADVGVEVSGSAGVSLDINPATGNFQETSAGQMYTVEKSVAVGASPIITALDVGIEGGTSYSNAYFWFQIPWWPALLP